MTKNQTTHKTQLGKRKFANIQRASGLTEHQINATLATLPATIQKKLSATELAAIVNAMNRQSVLERLKSVIDSAINSFHAYSKPRRAIIFRRDRLAYLADIRQFLQPAFIRCLTLISKIRGMK
jgi:hypothetical protein